MFDAALGIRVTNSRYRRDTDVTDITASRDLKRLCELDLFIPHGERKMRTYSAAQPLTDAWNAVRVKRAIDDPYELIKGRVRHARIEEEKESPRLPGF